MKEKYNNPFLARWLADELSEEELHEFQRSDEYMKYKEIIDTLDRATFPDYDIDTNYATLSNTIKSVSVKPDKTIQNKKYYLRLAYSIAAALLLYFGYKFGLQETSHTTQLAETKTFQLPDGSTVDLNSDSRLHYKTFNWKNNRKLTLEGEAFFKVEQGKSFTLHTKEGIVKVLGTQFNVNSRNNLYEVTCFEGRVEVILEKQDTIILTKGKAIIFQQNKLKKFSIDSPQPDWLLNESSFNNVHILEVINKLERQFNLTVQGKENLKPAYYSGRFRHDDVQTAVKIIFETMNIPYTFDNQKTLVIKKY